MSSISHLLLLVESSLVPPTRSCVGAWALAPPFLRALFALLRADSLVAPSTASLALAIAHRLLDLGDAADAQHASAVRVAMCAAGALEALDTMQGDSRAQGDGQANESASAIAEQAARLVARLRPSGPAQEGREDGSHDDQWQESESDEDPDDE